jgi:hypothetical protein
LAAIRAFFAPRAIPETARRYGCVVSQGKFMKNAIEPHVDRNQSAGPSKVGRLKLSPQMLRAFWSDFVTLASIGVCAWFLAKTVFHFWQ